VLFRSITSYVYDAKGNLLSITDPSGAKVSYQHDSKGNVNSVTDAKNQMTAFTYDLYNNLTSMIDPLGAVTIFAYDAAGNMTTKTDSQGNVTTFTYNSRNQLTSVTDPLGNTTTYTYDANGNKASATDANGNTTYFAYRYNGQVKKITDALGKITTLSYGSSGCPSCGGGVDKLTAVTDAKSNATSFEYDKAGHLIKATDPLGYITPYAYDSNGNLSTKTDANGNTITYSYDAINRLTQKIYPDGSGDAFQYDARGNVTYAGNGYIAYNFTYDSLNRVTSVTDSNSRTIRYTYDVNSNRLSLADPYGSQTQYGYNAANRLSSLQNGHGQITFAFDTLGRRTGLNYPNRLNNTYAFDSAGRLNSIALQDATSSTITSTSYTYDNAGNRISATTSPSSSGTANNLSQAQYTYDSGNRLTDDGIYTYSYDNNGNLITKTVKATGNITNYSWDAENRLIQVQMPSGSIVQYKYDPFGRRVEKNANGTITRYLYDNQNILFDYDQSGNVLRAYTHGAGIDEPLMWISGGTTYYYHADALGSISMISSASGTVIQTNVYDAFGSIQSGNTLSQPFAFTGREYDSETGLYYYRARYYDPLTGRFISKDPIGLNGGNVNLYGYVDTVWKPLNETNLYMYTRDNPVNLTDPFGLYGTKNCSYYQQACKTNGGTYECQIVGKACNFFSKNDDTSNCIRQCLQEKHKNRQPEGQCSEKGQTGWSDVFSEHTYCIVRCFMNSQNPDDLAGPSSPDKDISLY
jgi:RHS repeat-associated protein